MNEPNCMHGRSNLEISYFTNVQKHHKKLLYYYLADAGPPQMCKSRRANMKFSSSKSHFEQKVVPIQANAAAWGEAVLQIRISRTFRYILRSSCAIILLMPDRNNYVYLDGPTCTLAICGPKMRYFELVLVPSESRTVAGRSIH